LKNHKNDIGRIGIKGNRAANFAVANSDLVIVLGSSLSVPATGFQYNLFAREAKILVIDVDEEEHSKNTVPIDTFIKADLSDFFDVYSNIDYTHKNIWLGECLRWKEKWNNFDRPDINELNMYSFSRKLSEILSYSPLEKNVVTDAGSAYYVIAQTLQNANIILPSSQGEMGFMIPAAIGSYYANPDAFIIGVTGEGSFQFNIQELQTIVHNNLPITLIVLNNGGYLSIRNTQNKFFNSRLSGESKDSGISFPNLKKIAKAYGIEFKRIKTMKQLNKIDDLIHRNSPIIIEIMCPSDEAIYPTSATQQMEDGSLKSQPLENMFPFLSKEEFETEMIVGIFK
jgi:acetolactate synthase-1/2/3 large subunit